MRHSTRSFMHRALTVASVATVSALALAACSAPAADSGTDSGDFEPITSIKLQLQWLP